MQVIYWMLKLLGALSMVIVVSACSSSVKDFNVTLQIDDSLRNQYGLLPSFEVDVVAINADQEERIKNYDIDEYFEYQNPLRISLPKRTLKFSEDSAKSQSITSSDPIWKSWASNKAEILVLIANLPYAHGGLSNNTGTQGHDNLDGRRLLVPMQREHWYSLPTWSLYFLITPSGLIQLDKPKGKTDLVDTLNSIQENDVVQGAVKAIDTINKISNDANSVVQNIKSLK